MVIRNTGHIGSAVEFKINNHDPFEYPYYFDNRFATREPENDNETWWYVAFADEEAIKLHLNEQISPAAYIKRLILEDMKKNSHIVVTKTSNPVESKEDFDIKGFDFDLE